MLAAQAPWWGPGAASGYHDTTYGHLVGEVVRRITGTTLGSFFATEIAGPLGADFQIGVRDSDVPRISNVIFPGYPSRTTLRPRPLIPTASRSRPTDPPTTPVAEAATDAWRRAEIPAGNARSVATIQAIVSHGGAPAADSPHPDLVPYVPAGRCCFWLGWGGAIVVNDLDCQPTLAYVMNKMSVGSPGVLGTQRTKDYTRTAFR